MNLSHAVKRGSEILDSVRPLWYEDVNTEDLDMQSVDNCLLGQLYGRFSEGKKEIGLTLGASYGFAVSRGLKTSYEHRQAWKALRRLWIEEIETRRLSAELEDVSSGRALVLV